MSLILLLKNQRATGESIRSQLKNFYATKIESRTPAYATNRLEKISSSWKEFSENNAKIIESDEIDGEHNYFRENFFENVESDYLSYVNDLSAIINQATVESQSQSIGVDQSAIIVQSFDNNLEQLDPLELARRRQQEKRSTMLPPTNSSIGRESVDNFFKAYNMQHNQSGGQDESATNKYRNLHDEITFFIKSFDRYNNRRHTLDDRTAAQLQDSIMRKWEIIERMHQSFIIEYHDYDPAPYRRLEADFETALFEFKENISMRHNDSGDQTRSTSRMELSAKLPKLNVPKFSNDCTKYNSFKQLFMTMVGSRTSLTEVEKFAYLKGQLEGESSRLIFDLPIEDSSYRNAWDILDARFNNQHQIAIKLIAKIVDVKPMRNPTPGELKEMVDSLSQKVTGLINLGLALDSMSNSFFYFFTERKIHPDIIRIYENTLTTSVIPRKYEDLMNFLQTRVRNSSGADHQRSSHQGQNQRSSQNQSHQTQGNQRQNTSTSLVVAANSSNKKNDKCCCNGKHLLFRCPKFIAMNPNERHKKCMELRRCINCLKTGHAVRSCPSSPCSKCSKKHNTLLHFDTNVIERTALLGSAVGNDNFDHIFLATALVEVEDKYGNPIVLRALLDSGSQLNMITEKVHRKLGLVHNDTVMKINGVGSSAVESHKRTIIQVKSKNSGYHTALEVFVVRNATTCQPAQRISIDNWKIPKNLTLADPKFNIPAAIDIIIGGEFFYKMLSIGMISIGKNLPDLQNTVFGWVVIGKLLGLQQPEAFVGIVTRDSLDQQLSKFWKIEEKYQAPSNLTQLELECEEFFKNTTTRDQTTGRFTVKLQFLKEPSVLGKSEEMAIRRFLYLEKRFGKDPEMKSEYVRFMKEYEDLGHMEPVDRKNLGKEFYVIPHHAVRNPGSSTTKFRVVFDASAKTTSNISLNEILANGPVLQEDLFSIMVRFRKHRYVFSADITKMYRQVTVDPSEQKWQTIVWREDPSLPLQFYKLKTLTYGTTCASYLAIKSLQHLADEHKDLYPEGSIVAKRDFNVDDIMTGADDLHQTIVIQNELIELCRKGDFHLHKWCANHPALLDTIPKKKQEVSLDINAEKTETKALGMKWIPKTDIFSLHYQPKIFKRITKRTVLSETAQLFDPLGLVNPVIVMAKIFLQELWALKLDWDAALPMELHTKWDIFRNELIKLSDVSVARHLVIEDAIDLQLHAFSDASTRAYGTAVYLRSVSQNGKIKVNLICSKSRVAPVTATTLPRLELCAAMVMTELVEKLKMVLDMKISSSTNWTDSELVLSWIYSDKTYKTFVANRIAAIKQKTKTNEWRYVNTKENPADLISRGILPEKLINSKLWWHGPEFLSKKEEHWPAIKPAFVREISEERTIKTVLAAWKQNEHFIDRINHRNSFSTLQRVVAYLIRLQDHAKRIKLKIMKKTALNVCLSTLELEQAMVVIIKFCQEQSFSKELELVKKGMGEKTKFSNFVPIIDADGILRVGGRLHSANVPFEQKHPALLPKSHFITRLLMERIHFNNMHAGAQALLAITRQKYWPENGKRLAQQIVRNCVLCVRSKPKLMEQIMGVLPTERVNQARPFFHVGLDFGGPITIHYKLRGKRTTKAYICIFVCFTTKAVHIEAAADLTTESFINCLKRFIARRGLPKKVFCDNATNFVSASKQLTELKELMDNPEHQDMVIRYCQDHQIEWKFIPARSPHFGGLHESAIKSSKLHLRKVLHSVDVTYDELITILAEIEAILNSRPLTPMSNDPNDLQPLTAGHFLIGSPLNCIDDRALPETSKTKMWTKIRKLKQEFWNRWNKEYLAELQQRNKWVKDCENVKIGTMVILRDRNQPPLKWKIARVTKTFSDNFGKIRVVEVLTNTGDGFKTIILKRAIHEIAPLPDKSDEIQEDLGEEPLDVPCDPEEQSSGNKTKVNAAEISSNAQPIVRSTRSATKALNVQQQSVKKVQPKPVGSKKKLDPAASVFQPIMTRSAAKKGTSLYTTSLMIFSFFLVIIMGVSGQPCDVKSFSTSPGIYFEEQNHVSLTNDDWKIVCFAELTEYWNQYDTIKALLDQVDEMCHKLNNTEFCDVTMKQMRIQVATIQNKNELVRGFSHTRKRRAWSIEKNFNTLEKSETDQYNKLITKFKQFSVQSPTSTLKRQKRGWLNFIGTGLKTVTGVMNDDDAQHYDRKIGNLEQETAHLVQLIGNQTTMQEITSNIIKRDEAGIFRQLKKLEHEIISIKNRDEAGKAEAFHALALQAMMFIGNYNNLQDNIIEMIAQTHSGKVSANIITPIQLRQHLQTIAGNISKELMLPGDDNTENIAKIYAVMTAKIRITSSRIIFKITIPLLHREFYKLYHLIPVPFVYRNLTLNIIQTKYQFIGVNVKQDSYFLLSHQQQLDCKTYSEELLICEKNNPIFNTYGGEVSCEMAIFSHQAKRIPPKCITKQLSGKQLWSRLYSPNQFLFTMASLTAINFICKEKSSVCTVNGSGIINLPQECTIQSGNVEISSHNSHNSELPILFVPGINISDVIHEKYKPQSYVQTDQHDTYEPDSELDLLSSAIQTQKFNLNYTPAQIDWHDIHQYSIAYIALAIVLLFIIWYIFKFKFNIGCLLLNWCCHKQNAPVSTNEIEMAIPTAVPPIPAVRPKVKVFVPKREEESLDSISFS